MKNNNQGAKRTYHHKNTPSRRYAYKVSYDKNKEKVQLKAYGTEYKGNVNNLKKAGGPFFILSTSLIVISYSINAFCKYFINKKKADNMKDLERCKTECQKEIVDHKFEKEKELIDYRRNRSVNVVTNTSIQSEEHPKVSAREWIKRFDECYPMPKLKGDLNELIKGTPEGFKTPMILHLLMLYGALCFSRVRSLYLDKVKHAPNIQVIIEGESGAGKGKFNKIYKVLFGKVFNQDQIKLRETDEEKSKHMIVQNVGFNTSRAQFFELLAHNQNIHLVAVEEEIDSVKANIKRGNGLTYEHLRLAFDNGMVSQNNMSKVATKGSYPAFLNYTFTGTPDAVKNFISDSQIEKGNANRICWGIIPGLEDDIPMLHLPEENTMSGIIKNIHQWREKYCYHTVNGKDSACKEYPIDLEYVNTALKKWLDNQCSISIRENCKQRNGSRARMAALAFHFAIPLHMMYGEPKDPETRKMIVDITIYLANYCMERYLYKFAGVTEITADADIDYTVQAARVFSDDDRKEWYEMHESGKSYKTIADKFHIDKDTVRNGIEKYKRYHHVVDQDKQIPKVHEPNEAA